MLLVFASGLAFLLYPYLWGAMVDRELSLNAQGFLDRGETAPTAEVIVTIDSTEPTAPENVRAYPELWADMIRYNETIFTQGQAGLSCQYDYQKPSFSLTQYGLADEVFGVISIPAMELEMPIFLGATEQHMAAGAAHLSQTSLPIGGDNTNCIIVGHRGYNGASYYDQFRIQQEETRALWHDIRKLLQAAKLEGGGEALDQVEEMLHAVTGVVDVDNRTVSVILNEYAQTASQEGIQLHLDVQIPRELSVTAADLYILLGNTLDNAIEACAALPPEQREINIKLKTHNRILFYEIENPYAPSYGNRVRGGLHGYGLQNVRRCVEKYQGTLEIQKGDNIFRVIAHMNTY